jgi:hypothetical protein
MDWAKSLGLCMDFNPTGFAHPNAADGFTLAQKPVILSHESLRRRHQLGFVIKSKSVSLGLFLPRGLREPRRSTQSTITGAFRTIRQLVAAQGASFLGRGGIGLHWLDITDQPLHLSSLSHDLKTPGNPGPDLSRTQSSAASYRACHLKGAERGRK